MTDNMSFTVQLHRETKLFNFLPLSYCCLVRALPFKLMGTPEGSTEVGGQTVGILLCM